MKRKLNIDPKLKLAYHSTIQEYQDLGQSYDFSIASEVLKRDLYVDNLITGVNTLDDTVKLRDEITKLL